MHVEIRRPRDATELNNDGMIKLRYVHYQTEPNLSIFPKKDLINNDSSFDSLILSAILLTCSIMFSLCKAFVKCPSLSVNGIFW